MLPTITVDIGTTGVKLHLFDGAGDPVARRAHATPTMEDAWGDVYDVDALLSLVFDFVADLDPQWRSAVRRIALTGVGESGGLVRPDISLASPMILWHDQRGAPRLHGLDDTERLRIHHVTGLPANANYGLTKLAWALEHLDARDAGTADAQWLNITEYLAAVLTGQRWSEYSLASRTMALNLRTQDWSAPIASLFGVDDLRVFPALRAAHEGIRIDAARAAQLGLADDVLVHVAGHDHMVGAVASAIEDGEMLNSTGTTEGVLALRDEPALDERTARDKLAGGIVCTGDGYTLFASIPTGGSAFATLQSMLGMDAARLEELCVELHQRYLSGQVDLRRIPTVVPQFRGSPPPDKDPDARGAIVGLGSTTTAADIVFSTFLGMALQFRDVAELFRSRPRLIKVIGPAARNPLWLQLKADVLGVPLSASRADEVVSRGAQLLVAGERGRWEDLGPTSVEPDATRVIDAAHWVDRIRPQWELLRGAST